MFVGFLEDESALVLEVDGSGCYTSTLFVKEHTAHENLWQGERSGVAASQQLTAVDNTENINNLETHLIKANVQVSTPLRSVSALTQYRVIFDDGRQLSHLVQNLSAYNDIECTQLTTLAL